MSATKYAAIAAAVLGHNTLVAAVVGKKIRVLSLFLVAAADVSVAFESGAGGVALTGDMEIGDNQEAIVLPFNPEGWFETAAGSLLNLELGDATATAGCLSYVEVEGP